MFTVVPEERALIVAPPAAQGLLGWVPDSFPLDYQGRQFVGMPHTVDACIWLASRGLQPPAPIEHYYSWPRDEQTFPKVFAHQKHTAGFLTSNPRAYCLNDIGTMKTITSLWAADYLMSQGYIQRCLICAPIESLERAWADTLFFHLRHRSYAVLHGSKEKRRKLLAQMKDFYIINLDGIEVIEKELAARYDINACIIDELADYRNKHNAWKALNALVYPKGRPAMPWVWGLTGTPTPRAPTDAFHQCKLVTPATVPEYFGQFRNLTMHRESEYKWIPRKEATQIVYGVMRPAIRYKRDACLDLPGEVVTTLDAPMSAEQNKHYKDVMKQLYTEIQSKKVVAVNEGIKLSKLMQIACGVVYASDGTAVEIDAGERVELLLRTIERVQEKVIVFVPFTEVTNMLYKHISPHWSTAVVYGDVPRRERDQIFSDFQQKPDPSILIAHPGCMARSLTLTEASTIIWYAPTDSNYTYTQACGRVTRQGQKYVANIIHLAGSAVERKVYRRLAAQQAMQGLLLDMVEKGEQ